MLRAVGIALVLQPTISLSAQPVAVVEQGPSLEYQVKAAYLLNFVSFTEWPRSAFATDTAPLRICTAGGDPFGAVLDGTVEGEAVLGHPVVVERVMATGDARSCHVMFLARSQDGRVAEWLRAVHGAPVLTVGESAAFLRAGGIVSFAVDQGHVRFDVNRGAAEARGLKFSSRVLRLARSVM